MAIAKSQELPPGFHAVQHIDTWRSRKLRAGSWICVQTTGLKVALADLPGRSLWRIRIPMHLQSKIEDMTPDGQNRRIESESL